MSAYFHKKLNMICYDTDTLRDIFEQTSKNKIFRIIEEELAKSLSVDGLDNLEKMNKLINKNPLISDTDDLEIFFGGYLIHNFFDIKYKVCFPLKNGFDPKKNDIYSMIGIKNNLNKDNPIDFTLIRDEDNLIEHFQLKMYTGCTKIEDFLLFIDKKIKHYAYDLSNISILFNLKGTGNIEGDFFQNTHDFLKKLQIKGNGRIFITYNEENKFDVLNEVYPTLATRRVPYKKLSERL